MPSKDLYRRKNGVKGTVKWFDTTKGIGFIETEEGNEIFVNYTDLPIKNGRFITLQQIKESFLIFRKDKEVPKQKILKY